MSKGDISAGKAFIALYLKGLPEVQAGLNKVAGKFKAMGASLQIAGASILGVGTSIVGALGALTLNFASTGAALDDISQRTGIAGDKLSQLGHAATMAGTNIDTIERAIFRMQRVLVDAAKGTGAAREAFDALGLSAGDLMKLTPDEQFKAIAEAISKIKDPAMQAAIAMAIFGRRGQELLPLLNQGAEGISAAMQEAQDSGIGLTNEDIAAAAALDDQFERLKGTVKGLAMQVGAALAPAMSAFTDVAQRVLTPVVAFIRENRNLVVAIAGVGVAVMAIGGAFVGLGLTFSIISIAIGGLATAISAVGVILGVVASPVFLIVAGLIALGVAIAAAVVWALKAVGAFQGLGEQFSETWKGIVGAVKSGDLSLAFSIAVAQVKVIWMELINGLKAMWDDFIHYIASKILEVPGAEMLFGPEAGKKLDKQFAKRQGERDEDMERLTKELGKLQEEGKAAAIQMPKGAKFQFTDSAAASIQQGTADALTDRQRGTFSGDFASTRLGQGVVNTKDDKAKDAAIESSKTLKDILDEVKGLGLDFA